MATKQKIDFSIISAQAAKSFEEKAKPVAKQMLHSDLAAALFDQ
jgi:hypothetical protein